MGGGVEMFCDGNKFYKPEHVENFHDPLNTAKYFAVPSHCAIVPEIDHQFERRSGSQMVIKDAI